MNTRNNVLSINRFKWLIFICSQLAFQKTKHFCPTLGIKTASKQIERSSVNHHCHESPPCALSWIRAGTNSYNLFNVTLVTVIRAFPSTKYKTFSESSHIRDVWKGESSGPLDSLFGCLLAVGTVTVTGMQWQTTTMTGVKLHVNLVDMFDSIFVTFF